MNALARSCAWADGLLCVPAFHRRAALAQQQGDAAAADDARGAAELAVSMALLEAEREVLETNYQQLQEFAATDTITPAAGEMIAAE